MMMNNKINNSLAAPFERIQSHQFLMIFSRSPYSPYATIKKDERFDPIGPQVIDLIHVPGTICANLILLLCLSLGLIYNLSSK